jgi:hypothetical protein
MIFGLIGRAAIAGGAPPVERIGDHLALPGVAVSAWTRMLWPESSRLLFD